MSLSHIKNRREPTIFGKNLNVLVGDTIISGNVVVNGTINGTSSQGQNDNNVWTGTNTYSVERPTCSLLASNNSDAVNKTSMENSLTSNSIITKTATWSGVNTFSQNISVPLGSNPITATDSTPGQYLFNSMANKYSNFSGNSQVWTGTNTFTNYIPTRNIDEIASGSAVTKSYTDTTSSNLAIGNATSYASQTPLNDYNFGTTNLCHQIQIIGGGGGSTSGGQDCSPTFAGVSGSSSSTACLFLLTYSPLAVSLGLGTNLGRFAIEVGIGGSAGIGCGATASAGNGTPSVIYATPISSFGLTSTTFQILKTNGGNGFTGTCGQSGTTTGGLYSNANSNMVRPYFKSDGRAGTQNGGRIYQYAGYDEYGAGAPGLKCSNGVQGYAGGYTITSYEI